ncbi:YfcE family phosphodiesterase [Lacticaseibacillus hulanensis]|uniref:YfcE family phosphodiesterase n=1 Tax=Lacticaseibacillus hulanensis TaxID=2493111 RepID=UPI000FDCCE54|nr:metallophosphoesterase [Lacticaseibacillus hulanensis]
MRILAVSDTHGDDLILQELLVQYPDMDGYFYAGDSELRYDNPLFKTYAAVRGNMDFDDNFPDTVTKTIAGTTIFMTHGHLYGVGFGMEKLVAAASAVNARVAIYGHTHVAKAEQHSGVVCINPGSISQPRGELRNLGGTYALIEVQGSQVTVQYASRKGIIPELTQVFS